MLKILRKGFLILLGLLVLITAGTLLFAANPLFARALRTYGPKAIGQPLEFERTELSVFGGRAAIEGLKVGTDANPVAAVGAVRLDASTLDLLSGRIHVEDAVLEAARLHFIIDEEGRLGFDPGPPPPSVTGEKPGGVGAGREPEPAGEEDGPRDPVQIVQEYWERIQRYKGYYDKVGIFGGGEEEEDAEAETAAARRVRHPGKPSYLEAMPAASGPSLWIGHAGLEDFGWTTLDKRTGEPILPTFESFSLTLDRLGAAPAGVTEPGTVAGGGRFTGGGHLEFALNLSRSDALSGLDFEAKKLPLDSFFHLVRGALPYHMRGGTFDAVTSNLRFDSRTLKGEVRVSLRGVVVKAKRRAPDVLGVDAKQFAELLTSALKEQPVVFELALGGSPTRPTFSIRNETKVADLLGGAVKAEVQKRARSAAQELVDEKVGELAPGGLEGLLPGRSGGDEEEAMKAERRKKRREKEKEKEKESGGGSR